MGTDQRRTSVAECGCPACREHPHSATARQHRLLNRLVRSADERTRRLLAGFLAQQHGRGGMALLARITGLSPHTIRRGLSELKRPPRLPPGRVRRPGGGPKPVELAHPKSSGPWRGCSRIPPPATRSVV
jgi:hypothetical protein